MKRGLEGKKNKFGSRGASVKEEVALTMTASPREANAIDSDSSESDSNSNSNSDGMSEYERNRAHNIERNNARLKSLGLISSREERESNAAAWGRGANYPTPRERGVVADLGSGGDIVPSSSGDSVGERRQSSAVAGDQEPTRHSKRLRGEAAEVPSESGTCAGSPNAVTEEERAKEREERVRECREARLRAANAVAEAGHDAAAAKNRTATYEHCLMRVQTMSESGLANRVRAIERAAGKHCVVKMAIFKSCLQDEGLWDLAQAASGALERLKALQPPPSE